MEDGSTAVMQPNRLVRPRGPLRPRPPHREARYQMLLALRESNPERFRAEIARMRNLSVPKMPPRDPPEVFEKRRRAYFKRHGPARVCISPFFLTDLYEATCATKLQAEHYKRLFNRDLSMSTPCVKNSKTGLVDEEFTARMMKRYREGPVESSGTAVAPSDEVQEGISMLKLNHYEPGESSGTVVTASDEKLCGDCT